MNFFLKMLLIFSIAATSVAAIETDKQKHMGVSALLVLSSEELLSSNEDGLKKAIVMALAVGAAKEIIIDKQLGLGNPDWKDMAADTVGVLAGTIISTIVKKNKEVEIKIKKGGVILMYKIKF